MKLIFTPLSPSHFPLLLKWLSSPHVKAWWDPEIHWTLDRVKEKYGSYAEGYKWTEGFKKPLQAFIIWADGRPIGYIQFYNAYDFVREYEPPLAGLPKPLAALDFFMGEKAYLGKGLGTESLKGFLQDHIDPLYDACFVDPDSRNHRAIHVYEKVGFKNAKSPVEKVTWMVRTKP